MASIISSLPRISRPSLSNKRRLAARQHAEDEERRGQGRGCRTAAHTSLIDNGPVSATIGPRSAGFRSAALSGEDNADEIRIGNDGRPLFLSNNAGGILGGISTGQDLVVRFAVKPTSSILTPRRSIDRFRQEVEVVTKGRHDPCVGIRAVPVGEAMMAVVLADHLLRQRALTGRDGEA